MSGELIGLIGLISLFVLLGLRIPVAFAMFAVGFIGVSILNSPQAALSQLASDSFSLAAKVELVVVPLFILMGNVATETGMSRKLYDAAYAWIGSIRGGTGFGDGGGLRWFRGPVRVVGGVGPDHRARVLVRDETLQV